MGGIAHIAAARAYFARFFFAAACTLFDLVAGAAGGVEGF